MGYSLKGKMMATSKDDDKGTEAQRRVGLPSSSSSSASEGGRRDDGDNNQRTTHGFIQPTAEPKDEVVAEKRLNPSNSGSSISSMNVVSNDICKPESVHEVKPSESRDGSSQSLEVEGRQEETSPHPLSNPSSSSNFKALQHSSSSSSSSGNREKAPLSDRFTDARTTIPKHRLPAGPPIIGFRPPPPHGYRPEPPSYNHDHRFHHPHHPPYMSGPPPGQHYYGYSPPHRQRYPPPPVHHPTPRANSVGTKEEGVKSESANVEGAKESYLVNRENGASPTVSSLKRIEALPLKKRKMIDFSGDSHERIGSMKAISVDDHETNEKVNEFAHGDHGHNEGTIAERQSWEEEHYARYHTPRYSGPYPPPYHPHHGHYYSPYHPPESDYYSPPRSHGRHHHYRQAPHEHQHHHRHQQHKSVSPVDEVCGSSNESNNETMAESVKQEYSSRMDKLATAADTLEIRSEASAKAEDDEGEDGDDDMSAKAGTDHKKCVPICSSLLTKYLKKNEATVSLPAFAELVNFPEHLPEKGSPSRKSNGKSTPPKQPSEKPCVMCGVTCIFAGTTPSRLHAQMKQSIIPKQNKGLCNSCDGKTWIFSELNAPIKWCKGCKNFRSLRNFGDKYRATKCVRCRQRQRDNYAELKRKRDAQNEGATLLVQQKTGWGSASDESERGSPELDAAIALANLIS